MVIVAVCALVIGIVAAVAIAAVVGRPDVAPLLRDLPDVRYPEQFEEEMRRARRARE